jgi:hypothetical protein
VASPETEQALSLTPADRIEILRRLGAQDFFDGLPDGAAFDAGARGALERWQRARDLAPSGYLNRLQFDKLMAESPNVVRRAVDSPAATPRSPAADPLQPFAPVWRFERLPDGRTRTID